jgi:hypothetical protein
MDCCENPRLCNADAKCSDLFDASIGNKNYSGYVPADLGIGEGDYVRFTFCLNCGRIQGTWPRPETALELGYEEGYETCGDCDGEGTCSACDGTGDEDGETCENCDGSGHCGTCDGTGKVELDT